MKGIKQHDTRDCGLACLATIFSFYDFQISIVKLRNHIRVDRNGLSIYDLVKISEKYNFNATVLNGTIAELKEAISQYSVHLPILAHAFVEKNLLHYIVIKEITNKNVKIFDPAKGDCVCSIEEFLNIWTGYIINIEPGNNFKKANVRKGEYVKYLKIIDSLKDLIAVTLILSFVISGLSVLFTMIYQKLIDEYILQDSYANINFVLSQKAIFLHDIVLICAVFIGIIVINTLLSYVRGKLILLLSKKANIILSEKYYSKLMKLPTSFYQDRDAGEVMSRYQEITEIHSFISETCLVFVFDFVMVLIAGIILCGYNSFLFGVLLSVQIIYCFIVFGYRKNIQEKSREIKENYTTLNSFLKDSIDGIETIKLNTRESEKQKTFSEILTKMLESDFRLGKLTLCLNSLVEGIDEVGIVIILCCGSILIKQNIITLGELITFDAMLSFFVTPVKELISLQPTIQKTIVIFDRLNDVLEYVDEQNLCKRDYKGELCWEKIEIENISFAYGFGQNILNKLSLILEKGNHIVINGKSGCGKSTLAKLLLGLEIANEGKIMVDNININNISLEEIRNNVAYVPQKIFLFNGTIKSNLGLEQTSFDNEFVMHILQGCKITEIINSKEHNIEHFVCENGKNLSGGQRQRIAIARALLRQPKVLILDEATNQLDRETENDILRFIHEKFPDLICVHITHSIDVASNYDRIVSM